MRFWTKTYPARSFVKYRGKLYVAVAEGHQEDDVLSLFHHIHHEDVEGDDELEEKVHHCGGEHVKVDPTVDYNIEHCSHGKHSIDKEIAIGHGTDEDMEPVELSVQFKEKCSDCSGCWHIESGEVAEEEK